MKYLALCLMLGMSAWGQGKRECTPCSTKGGGLCGAMSNGFDQYTCSKEGKWVVDKEAEKESAKRESHKMDLAHAMQVRPLTNEELKEVEDFGSDLLTHPMQPYFKDEVDKRFSQLLLAQYQLRAEAAKEHSASTFDRDISKPEPFDVPAVKVGVELGWNCDEKSHACVDGMVDKLECADKERIGPFWSKDGKSHCLKFPKERP